MQIKHPDMKRRQAEIDRIASIVKRYDTTYTWATVITNPLDGTNTCVFPKSITIKKDSSSINFLFLNVEDDAYSGALLDTAELSLIRTRLESMHGLPHDLNGK